MNTRQPINVLIDIEKPDLFESSNLRNVDVSEKIQTMRIGAFEINEPVPQLEQPIVVAMLKPWIDVGRVGTLTLGKIEQSVDAKELGRLDRPGTFFDFTRYRPRIKITDGIRSFVTPNSEIKYGQDDQSGQDYIFLHLREPHSMSEDYIDSVVSVIEHFGVSEYYRVGGMYDTVPHSRPLLVTGTLNPEKTELVADLISNGSPSYQGPTSIVNLVAESLEQSSVDCSSLMVHLPQYAQLQEDHMGSATLLSILCALCDLPKTLSDSTRGNQQYQEISRAVKLNPELQKLISQFEAYHDRILDGQETSAGDFNLSPEIEEFLNSVSERLDDQNTTIS
ncbi:MAG: PAC2 family protein [Chloroflexota bacterium]|nr:PAC2 family protein [Chloroflexota bacterium]